MSSTAFLFLFHHRYLVYKKSWYKQHDCRNCKVFWISTLLSGVIIIATSLPVYLAIYIAFPSADWIRRAIIPASVNVCDSEVESASLISNKASTIISTGGEKLLHFSFNSSTTCSENILTESSLSYLLCAGQMLIIRTIFLSLAANVMSSSLTHSLNKFPSIQLFCWEAIETR